jgi:hypothetical protein
MFNKKNLVLLFTLLIPTIKAHDLLPDLVTQKSYLNNTKIDTKTMPGHILLRFSNSTPNKGTGPLELRGGPIEGDYQSVFQRIYNTDKTFREEYAGTYIYHPDHKHVHFEGYAQYRLRKMTSDGGLGEIVVEGEKTSYCLRDNIIVNPFKKNFSFRKKYKECDRGIQGISVGWTDLYAKKLPDQWIDLTNQPTGEYWLESEVNPDHSIVESNYDNNISRVSFCLKERNKISFQRCELPQ